MRTAADKAIATHSQRMKEQSDKGGDGGSASGGAAHKSAQALGMSAALGALVAAPPPPPPPADGSAAGGEGGLAPQSTLTPAQMQEGLKFMAAVAAAQPGLADPFTMALMPGFLAPGTDPFLNLPGSTGNEL